MQYVDWVVMVGLALPFVTLQLDAGLVVFTLGPVTTQEVFTPVALQATRVELPEATRVGEAVIVGLGLAPQAPAMLTGEQSALALCPPLVALTCAA